MPAIKSPDILTPTMNADVSKNVEFLYMEVTISGGFNTKITSSIYKQYLVEEKCLFLIFLEYK